MDVANRDFSIVVHKLWPWCVTKQSLLLVTLKMLCTYTNDCFQGTSWIFVESLIYKMKKLTWETFQWFQVVDRWRRRRIAQWWAWEKCQDRLRWWAQYSIRYRWKWIRCRNANNIKRSDSVWKFYPIAAEWTNVGRSYRKVTFFKVFPKSIRKNRKKDPTAKQSPNRGFIFF